MCDLCLGWNQASIMDTQIQKTSISLMARYMLHIIVCHKVCILSYKHIGVSGFTPIMAQENPRCTTIAFLAELMQLKQVKQKFPILL